MSLKNLSETVSENTRTVCRTLTGTLTLLKAINNNCHWKYIRLELSLELSPELGVVHLVPTGTVTEKSRPDGPRRRRSPPTPESRRRCHRFEVGT